MTKITLTQKQMDTLAALLDAGVKAIGLACVVDVADLVQAIKAGEPVQEDRKPDAE